MNADKRPLKQETLWAIYYGRIMLPLTVRPWRGDCIKRFIKDRGLPDWTKCRKRGYSIQKLICTPQP